VIADIHFQPRYIFAALDAGCAAVRVNPGNIKEFDGRVGEVARLREGTAILYSGHNYDKALFLSRLGMLPFFWIACLVVFEWGRRYFNAAIGLLAVAAFSFEPTILAHAGLSTTDMALTAFLSATFLTGTMWLEQPTVRRAALFGVCGGLVVSSKFSCLVFFPASAALALLWYYLRRRPKLGEIGEGLRRRLPGLGLAAVVAFFVVWAVYRFSFGPVPFAHLKLPFPELYAGIEEVRQHNAFGQESYLFGERSRHGWWYFFPVVFGVKTPLAYLILLGVGIWLTALSTTRWLVSGAISNPRLLPPSPAIWAESSVEDPARTAIRNAEVTSVQRRTAFDRVAIRDPVICNSPRGLMVSILLCRRLGRLRGAGS